MIKTEQEIRQMVNTCNMYRNCAGCPYNPEDISRFIGRGEWKGGCPNYDRKLVYAMGKGYGDVSEYKAEIERLKAEFKQLETNAEILARGVRDLNHENYELTEKIKQAQIDILNKVKDIVFDYLGVKNIKEAEALSLLDSTLTYDVVTCGIDELIKEVQNAEDKG